MDIAHHKLESWQSYFERGRYGSRRQYLPFNVDKVCGFCGEPLNLEIESEYFSETCTTCQEGFNETKDNIGDQHE